MWRDVGAIGILLFTIATVILFMFTNGAEAEEHWITLYETQHSMFCYDSVKTRSDKCLIYTRLMFVPKDEDFYLIDNILINTENKMVRIDKTIKYMPDETEIEIHRDNVNPWQKVEEGTVLKVVIDKIIKLEMGKLL